ncbi:MAG: M14 family zinc carboxypeptidase [Thermoplasmatota archaeon]
MEGSQISGPRSRTILISVLLVSSAFLFLTGGTGEAERSVGPVPSLDPPFQVPDGILEESNFTTYYDYNSMTEYLQFLEQTRPDIVKLWSIGRTHEGRDIWCLKLSDEPGLEDDGGSSVEDNVLLVGAHHGNEWISYEVPLYVLSFLVRNYGQETENGSIATYIVDNREVYFIPILNADGVQYAHESERGWRKNREPNYISEFGPGGVINPDLVPLSYGVDINRNYGWAWHEAGGSNVLVTSGASYRGPPDNVDDDGDAVIPIDVRPGYIPVGPDEGVDEDPWDGIDNDGDGEVDEDPAGGFSSLETIAMRELGEEHLFPVAITYHSYSRLVLWPWGNTPEPTKDAAVLEQLGTRMAEMNEYRPMQGYELYPVTGEFNDWFYSQYGTFGYTFEVGNRHTIPAEEIRENCELNLEPTLYLCHAAANPYESFIRFDENSTRWEKTRDGARLSLSYIDEGYPTPMNLDRTRVHFQWGDGEWMTAPVVEDEDGNLSAEVLKVSKDRELRFYFELVDTQGRSVTEPTFAPNQFHTIVLDEGGELYMEFGAATVFVMLFTLGIVWGGFVGGIGKALRSKKGVD